MGLAALHKYAPAAGINQALNVQLLESVIGASL